MALIPLLGFALLMIYVLRWSDQSVDAFASANGLTLDRDTKSFITFHLARMKMLRQWGALAGFLVGVIEASLFHRNDAHWVVFVLVGSLVGMGVAEAAQFVGSPRRETQRFADLDRRNRSRYVSTTSRRVEWAVMIAFAASAVVSVSSRSHKPLWARIAIITVGAAVIVGGRAVAHRVAIRSIDPTNSERRPADEAIRRAAVNVVSAIVASSTLCATAWLLSAPITHTTLTARFANGTIVRIDNIGFPYEVSAAAGESATVTWQDPANGATKSTVVPLPPTPAEDENRVSTSHPLLDDIRNDAVGVAGLLAFIAWLQVSRIPFRGRRDRPARRGLVGVSG